MPMWDEKTDRKYQVKKVAQSLHITEEEAEDVMIEYAWSCRHLSLNLNLRY